MFVLVNHLGLPSQHSSGKDTEPVLAADTARFSELAAAFDKNRGRHRDHGWPLCLRIYSFPQTGFWNKVSLVERGRGNVPVLLVWGWGELVMLRSHDGLEAALGIATLFPLIPLSAER